MHQNQLFPAGPGSVAPIELPLQGGQLTLHTTFCDASEARALYAALADLPGWRQDSIVLFGKRYPLPRLHRWFANSGQSYQWSGLRMVAEQFPEVLDSVRERLTAVANAGFNTALGNLYRGGSDSVGWHSDDEPELGPEPCIASLSLGAERQFFLRRKDNHRERLALTLPHGSLLVMSGGVQRYWQHCIPKARRAVAPRINLTFRYVAPSPLPDALTQAAKGLSR